KYSDVWLSDIKTTIDFNVSAPDVSQILDDAAGAIESAATIQGNILTPNIKVTAHAGDLSYEEARLEQVDVSFTTNGETNWRSHLALSANNASFNKQEVKSTVLTIDGDLDRQTISAEVNAENWRSEQRVTADLLDIDTLHWEGVWEKGMFQYEDYVLNKDSNTDFSFDIEQQHAKLAGHCWREPIAEAELCTKDLEFESNNVDIDTAMTINIGELLDVFRPDLFRPGSELLLKSTVNGTYSQKDGLNIKSGNLMQGSVLTTNHSLDISAIVANINATQDEIASVVFAGTQETGRVGLSSKLEFNGGAYQHAGRLSVDNLQLSLLRRFAPAVNQLQGKVNANVMFEGDLTQPGLFGEAIIEDGALTLDAYTYPLTQFMQSIVFDHKTASTNGGFRLGNGEAEFSADMNFDSALTVAGDIKGSGLEIAYKTYDLTTSPSINFSMTPELIDVDGKIVIDATDIKIDSLPESVRSPSSDVIVIGQKPPEPLLPIALDIKLQVLADPQEKETIQIDALGLKASLSGDLDLTVLQQPGSEKNTYQPMQTFLNGYLNVLSGSYDAWGQALQIQSGSVYFNGEPSLPEFDITAVRNPLNTQGDVVAGIKASGNPIIPKIELFSEPPMEQARQLSYLLRGQDLSGGSQADLNTQLINVLVGYGVGKNENRISRVGKALGFDSLNVQTAGQGDTTQVQVTGRIAEDLQITYAVGVFDAASEVILKYQLLPQLYIEATSGGLIHALDMFYEFSRGNMTSSDSETQ
ncbi:MAG: translocation/assembly module TamB domain-containing protein, partial [Pseudomonadota bacterium]